MHRILNNWTLKLISIVLAVMLWSHVRGEVNPLEDTTVEVPLRVRAPQGFRVAENQNIPVRVSVFLRGPRQSLREIKGGSLPNALAAPNTPPLVVGNSIRSEIAWERPRAGEQEVSIRAETNVSDIQVLDTKPDKISIVLQRETSSLPIEDSKNVIVN